MSERGNWMGKLNDCSTVCEGAELSRSVKVCVVVAVAIGVPVIAPVAVSKVRLLGSAGETDHV